MDRMVAVCDILGFKELVKRRELESLIDNELALFRRLVGYSVKQCEVPDIPPKLLEIRQQDRVGIAWFSDTVIIYSKTNEDMACRDVLETVGWLLFASMNTRTRIRAGIAFGPMYADPENEMYVGSALVEAYQLEKVQQWAGAALSRSAVARLPVRNTTGARFQWWVCEYDAPIQVSESEVEFGGLVVDWTQAIHKDFKILWSKKNHEPTADDVVQNRSVYEKWENTRLFHRDICISCYPENVGKDPLKVL